VGIKERRRRRRRKRKMRVGSLLLSFAIRKKKYK
jgi:hypothetical protein